MIEKVDMHEKSEALAVLKQAFASHTMLPPGTPMETTAALLELIMDSFGRTEDSHLFGIRKEGILTCVSFSVDSRNEPKGMAMLYFFSRLLRILGWRLTRDFALALSKRPNYENPYLDLALLGTLPANHGQGLGRTMLRFLYGFAKEHHYHGVILGVAKDTPAHHLYLKEGFVADNTVSLSGMSLCHMRRDNDS